MACRILLGIMESGFFPGVLFYLTFWYKKSEMSERIALFYCFSTISGVLSGLLGYAISSMNGFWGLQGWRWIFILEGIPSALCGIAAFWVLPDYPETCQFLNAGEKEIVCSRLKEAGANHSSESALDKSQFADVVLSPTTYLICTSCLLQGTCFYSYTFSFPTILVELGFRDLTAQLMSVPPYLLALFSTLLVSRIADRYNMRLAMIIVFGVVRVVGFLGMMCKKIQASI